MSSALSLDKYIVGANDVTIQDLAGNRLDGEWTDNVTVTYSGNNVAGGVFGFRFNVAPGNYDLSSNGLAGLFDLGVFGFAYGSTIGAGTYNRFADADGDGTVGLLDLGIFGLAFGRQLPPGSANLPAFDVGAFDQTWPGVWLLSNPIAPIDLVLAEEEEHDAVDPYHELRLRDDPTVVDELVLADPLLGVRETT